MHVAEEIIRLCYAPRIEDLPWTKEAAEIPSLSQRYLAYRDELAGLNLDPEHTALEWLRRERTLLFAERCQDIARWDMMKKAFGRNKGDGLNGSGGDGSNS